MKKLVLTASLALVALFAIAATASAYTATVRNAGAISTVSSGKVTFTAGTSRIECNLTLPGTLASSVATIEQEVGQSLGAIEGTRVTWAECVGGTVSATLGASWNLKFNRIEGTLPERVTAVDFTIQNAEFLLSTFGGFANCLYHGEAPVTMATNTTRTVDVYTSGTIRTTESLFSLVSGSLCPSSGRMTGTFTMSPQQTITVS